MKYPQVPHEVVVAALRTACHSFEDANARWAGHIKSGMSDDQVLAALGKEFGIWGGSGVYALGDDGPRCEWWQDHRGGVNPSIAVYRFAEMNVDEARLTMKVSGSSTSPAKYSKSRFQTGGYNSTCSRRLVHLRCLRHTIKTRRRKERR